MGETNRDDRGGNRRGGASPRPPPTGLVRPPLGNPSASNTAARDEPKRRSPVIPLESLDPEGLESVRFQETLQSLRRTSFFRDHQGLRLGNGPQAPSPAAPRPADRLRRIARIVSSMPEVSSMSGVSSTHRVSSAYRVSSTHSVSSMLGRPRSGPRCARIRAPEGRVPRPDEAAAASRKGRRRELPAAATPVRASRVKNWSGREDLNLRPQRPERCALAKLSHAPDVSNEASGGPAPNQARPWTGVTCPGRRRRRRSAPPGSS